jgi:D-lactate dehydrogenase
MTPPLQTDEKEVPQPIKRMRYSHFGCNVVHEDLAYEPRVDVKQAKQALKASVEHQCNGKLPAEHGHGTEYTAPKDTQERWKQMDPLNVLNPGIGGLSEHFCYKDES